MYIIKQVVLDTVVNKLQRSAINISSYKSVKDLLFYEYLGICLGSLGPKQFIFLVLSYGILPLFNTDYSQYSRRL